MPDIGEKATEREYRRLKGKLKSVYSQAYEEIYKKNLDFVRGSEKREAQYRQMVKDGKITQDDFDAWKRGQVFQGDQWEARRKQMQETLLHTDEMAMDMVNDSRFPIFAANANYIGYELEEHGRIDTSFGIYDANTVKRLVKDEPDLLPPKKKVGKDKAYKWYNKQIQTAITQGILQGEPIEDIAKRIAKQTGETNMNAMLRNARTMHTGAQNAGRIEGLHQAQDLGISVKKKWLATLDDRTRDAHAELDGQVQEVDDPFESELGPIMYPGDASADPANVWNCRCTLIYVYPEYPSTMQRRDNETGEVIVDMTYGEWEKRKSAIIPSGTNEIQVFDKKIRRLEKRLDKWDDSKYDNIAVSANEYLKVQDEIDALYEQRAEQPYPDDDVMVGIAHIKQKHTVTQDILRVNQKFGSAAEWNRNCQRCVPTYEMRRRGYDVKVLPRKMKDDNVAANWRNIFENAQWEKCDNGSGYNGVVRRMRDWGDGARAEVYVKWKDSEVTHVFVAENVKGEVHFRDPQSGYTEFPPWTTRVEEGWTEVCRIDNLKPSKLILECMEEV